MNGRVSVRNAALLGTIACAAAIAAEVPEDIRDIRGPKFVRPEWLVPVLVSAGVLLALCTYGVWRWRRRRKTPARLPSFEIALQRLEEIRPLMVPGKARDFGIAVSDIIRDYIERRFEVVATQRTTEEFLQDLLAAANESLVRHRPLLSEFLQQCDLVKFAGLSPAPLMMESLWQSARAFVLETAQTDATLSAT